MKVEQTRKCNENSIEVINSQKAKEIIENREPIGRFIIEYVGNIYTGIDNSNGDAWTEDFKSFDNCINWLKGEDLEKKECYVCEAECEELYKYDNKYYCAECLLELLEQHKEIETFEYGKGYMINGEFVGNDADNSLDEIVENLIGNLEIEKVE